MAVVMQLNIQTRIFSCILYKTVTFSFFAEYLCIDSDNLFYHVPILNPKLYICLLDSYTKGTFLIIHN